MDTPDIRTISTSLLLRLLLLFLFPELNEAKHTQHLLNDADDNRHYPKTDPPPRLSSTLPMCLQNIVLYLRRVQLNNTHSDVQLLLFSLKHRSVCSSLHTVLCSHCQLHTHSIYIQEETHRDRTTVRTTSESSPPFPPSILVSFLLSFLNPALVVSSSSPSLVSSSPLLSLLARGHY